MHVEQAQAPHHRHWRQRTRLAVMGILERGGKVRTTVVPNRKKKALQAEVKKHVEAGAALYTDALLSYEGLAARLRASGH